MLDTYILLLKQHLQRMNVWLKMAESRIKQEGEIGPGYDDVRKQLEDHQVEMYYYVEEFVLVTFGAPFIFRSKRKDHAWTCL